jgi:hypothetical protein
MFNEFKDRLNSVREESERVYKTSECIKTIFDTVDKELSVYTKVIPEFFSYNNEALKIKALYKKLKELDYVRNRVITCIDVDRAGHLYMEYFTGMCTFIDKFINEACAENPENLPLMEKQLQTAIQADPVFIDSLFGGKNNERCEEELTNAVKNVEYLVDFLNTLNDMRNAIATICDKAIPVSEKYGFILHAVRLAANSACSASHKIICTILDTYNDINCSLDDKPVVQVDNTLKVF